jgi:hypothetical protein
MMTKRFTYVFLGIFLIVTGLLNFISELDTLSIVAPILAIAVGVLILIATPGISIFFGWIVASIYLLVRGGSAVLNLSFSGMDTFLSILALAAGILLIIRTPGFRHHIGFLLFCLWLILIGLVGLVSVGELGSIIAGIAIASGILLILNQ